MDSSHREIQHWTFLNLILAFFNLLVAYFILCTSAIMFFPLKILAFLHLHLPCPCSGFLGSQNTDFCWHKLFLHTPFRIISETIKVGIIKFPFNLLFQQNHPNSSNSKLSDHSKGIPRCNSVYIGSRRRKRIAVKKRKLDLRRKNRSFSSADAISTRIESPISIEDRSLDNVELHDEENAKGNISRCKMLERALLEEKSAVAAVCLELEKERAAAASAADEAMGMMLRLHEEKAQLLMEAKQYQRAIEEKFAYEHGEMDELKDILIKRDKENIFLQRELESYKEMDVVSIKELDEDGSKQFWEKERSVIGSSVCSPSKEFVSERERYGCESSVCSPSKLFVCERESSVLDSSICSPSKLYVKRLCYANDDEINGGEFMNCIFIKKDAGYNEEDSPMHDIHVIDT